MYKLIKNTQLQVILKDLKKFQFHNFKIWRRKFSLFKTTPNLSNRAHPSHHQPRESKTQRALAMYEACPESKCRLKKNTYRQILF